MYVLPGKEVIAAIERSGIAGATSDEIADYLEIGVSHVECAMLKLGATLEIVNGFGRDGRPLSRRRKFDRGSPALLETRLRVFYTPETWEKAKL